jgi:hypothetical protein
MRPRDQLVDRLLDLGWTVTIGPHGAVGWYRVNRRFDDTIVTWECWAHRTGDNPDFQSKHLVSYDTMTACARRGCRVSEIGDVWWVSVTQSAHKPEWEP